MVVVARETIVEDERPAPVVVREEELVKVMPNVATPVMFRTEPVKAKVVEAGDSGIRHKVKSGDSIWGITRKYKVAQADLLGLNGIADPNKLRLGMELKIPAK